MAYQFTPGLASVNSGVFIVGTVTVTVVAAPGANLRLRISSYSIGINRTATGIVDVVLRDTTSVFGWRIFGLQLSGTSNVVQTLPFPGFVLPINQALQCDFVSTAAAGVGQVSVSYYQDNVT